MVEFVREVSKKTSRRGRRKTPTPHKGGQSEESHGRDGGTRNCYNMRIVAESITLKLPTLGPGGW